MSNIGILPKMAERQDREKLHHIIIPDGVNCMAGDWEQFRPAVNVVSGSYVVPQVEGIYELAVRKTGNSNNIIVVYLGSSRNLQARLGDHVNLRSHINQYINAAKKNRYEIFFRYRLTIEQMCDIVNVDCHGGEPLMICTAMAVENSLLARYDYAWNSRRNGLRRDIL